MKNETYNPLEHLPKNDPPDFVWDRITNVLDKDKKRRFPVWIWYASSIAAGLALLLLVRTGFQEERSVPTASRNKTADQTVQEKPNASPVTDSSPLIQYTEPITPKEEVFVNGNTNGLIYQWDFGDAAKPQPTYFLSGAYSVYTSPLNVQDQTGFTWTNSNINVRTDELNRSRLWNTADTITPEEPGSESYAQLMENEYLSPFSEPLSTFSIDVDNASYSNSRRMIEGQSLPPKDAVRIEEFINYFDYDYPQPTGEDPFSINLETASSPWNQETRIVMIGLQGKEIERKKVPASNLVFLIDVSGSMSDQNKLPLVKKSLSLLVEELGPEDYISIVTYAGAAGLVLDATSCAQKWIITNAINKLESGGSTAGGEGLELAYKVARENLKKDGNNRIILVTDGDFNVGLQSDEEMKKLIEERRKDGIYLTVCGFGMGNYKDSKMEILADQGNGNYYYIDNYNESKKVFVTGLTGTLFTIAKDVKIQVEFNPKLVKAYRLIGYENRKMPPQDFDDDAKDAGELGAGHTVTALYEIVPAGSRMEIPGFTPTYDWGYHFKEYGNELLTVKLRYKKPKEENSKLLEQTMSTNQNTYDRASENFRYACGVAAYGMLLRDSKFRGNATYDMAKNLIEGTSLNVKNGYQAELLELINKAAQLSTAAKEER